MLAAFTRVDSQTEQKDMLPTSITTSVAWRSARTTIVEADGTSIFLSDTRLTDSDIAE